MFSGIKSVLWVPSPCATALVLNKRVLLVLRGVWPGWEEKTCPPSSWSLTTTHLAWLRYWTVLPNHVQCWRVYSINKRDTAVNNAVHLNEVTMYDRKGNVGFFRCTVAVLWSRLQRQWSVNAAGAGPSLLQAVHLQEDPCWVGAAQAPACMAHWYL